MTQATNDSASNAIRLVNLRTGKSTALATFAPTVLEGTVRLTIADADGNAMLERIGKDAAKLSIDGAPVFEIAHFKPRQLIETETGAYVTLRAYDAFLRPDTAAEERLARWRQLTTRARLKDMSAGEPVAQVLEAKSKRAPRQSSPRNFVRLVGGAAILALVAAGLMLRSGGDASSGPSPDEMQEQIAKVEPPPPAPMPEPEVVKAPAPAPVDAPTKVEAVVAAAKPKPVEPPKAAPAKAKPVAPTPPAAAAPKLSAAKEQQIRERMESLLLEANYDPHSARRSLDALSRTVPVGSALHRDIRQAIGAIQ